MRRLATSWTAYGEVSRAVLVWHLDSGRTRAARVELAVALGAGMREMRALLGCRRMPTAAQRETLARVVGVPVEAWDR